MIENLFDKADVFLIGGGMANTFIKALGGNVANSLCENDKLDLAKELFEKAKSKGVKILLPVDFKVAKSPDAQEVSVSPATNVPEGYAAFDIGPETIEAFKAELKTAKTVFWNGPLGMFEKSPFDEGTNEIAKFIVSLKEVVSVAGGGDTAAALKKAGLDDKFSHVSTGGGASLEFMEGRSLPGIEALLDK